MSHTVVRAVRRVPVGGSPRPGRLPGEAEGVVDLRLVGGRITEVGHRLDATGADEVVDGEGRWAIPGLWDQHTHPVMWALARRRIDLSGSADALETVRRVREHLDGIPDGDGLVLGFGYRSGGWAESASVALLDRATGARPVALTSGDGHHAWLNSAALSRLGLPAREGVLAENEWYAVAPRLEALDPDARDPLPALRDVLADAHARGVVGLVDLEFGSAFRIWPERVGRGLRTMRVRAATYADHLEEVADLGLRTGDPVVPGHPLVTMGPLKVIGDGSLNTLTAWCCSPYLESERLEHPCGRPNHGFDELVALMTRAREIGLSAAIHAIGDRAVSTTLDAFEVTGQTGTMEHAQLVRWADIPRLARLGVVASVQPAHAPDDRDVAERWWGDRSERLYAFRAMVDAGVQLALGSDAPVSPLDPWLAIACAVHRSMDDREAWHPEQALTVEEALAASTDGQGTMEVGSRADVVLLDADPLAGPRGEPAQHAAYLRAMPVAATLVDGRVVHTAG
ncbi:MAG: amidohydrolase [Tetrasphaera sp.]|nr:amidohydrolase [Tetrasphaera sp.]